MTMIENEHIDEMIKKYDEMVITIANALLKVIEGRCKA